MTVDRLAELELALGAGAGDVMRPGLPVLGGEAVERIFPSLVRAGAVGPWSLYQAPGWLVGAASVTLGPGIEEATHGLYRALLASGEGFHLARIWNYVPAINETGPAGLENYRLFCRGRSSAFEAQHGSGFKSHLPAASAVGCVGDQLTVVFAACSAVPHHVENPLQLPAYEYPADYGPRPPSFARATVVDAANGPAIFVSGTAAIRGHVTIAPHRTAAQLECTIENLAAISQACGLGGDFGAGSGLTRHWKVYLRAPADYAQVAPEVQRRLWRPGDRVSYVEAAICRADLNVEIEVSLLA